MKKGHCENCYYYDDFLGSCHRYPPVYANPAPHGYRFEFVAVEVYGWCGEYKKKEEEPKNDDI